MQKDLPDKTPKEIKVISDEIVLSLETTTEKRKSIENAISQGRSKESWFNNEIKNATSAMTTQQSVQYLKSLDQAVYDANTALQKTIHTQSGVLL